MPTNGSIFFIIFHTFMTGPESSPCFGEYPPDYFDLVIIDECHHGGANNESNWRSLLEYFLPAVQIGLTATPKRRDNVDTYEYFGEPTSIYSLRKGIEDGFLTPVVVFPLQGVGRVDKMDSVGGRGDWVALLGLCERTRADTQVRPYKNWMPYRAITTSCLFRAGRRCWLWG